MAPARKPARVCDPPSGPHAMPMPKMPKDMGGNKSGKQMPMKPSNPKGKR